MAETERSDEPRPGDVDDGFNRIARDLDRAFALARLSGLETFLVQQAREASWTMATLESTKARRAPAKPFRLDLSALAKLAGCSREALTRAKADLVAKGIFEPRDDGSLAIVKDFRAWKRPGTEPGTHEQLLDDAQVKFALKAKGLGKRKGCDEKVTPPYRTHARSESAERERGEEGRPPGPAPIPPVPDPESSPWDIHPGPHEPSPEDAAELFRYAWRLFPGGGNLAYEVWSWQRWHSLKAWRKALREAAKTNAGCTSGKYVQRIAERLEAQNKVDDAPAPAAAAAPPAPQEYFRATGNRSYDGPLPTSRRARR